MYLFLSFLFLVFTCDVVFLRCDTPRVILSRREAPSRRISHKAWRLRSCRCHGSPRAKCPSGFTTDSALWASLKMTLFLGAVIPVCGRASLVAYGRPSDGVPQILPSSRRTYRVRSTYRTPKAYIKAPKGLYRGAKPHLYLASRILYLSFTWSSYFCGTL